MRFLITIAIIFSALISYGAERRSGGTSRHSESVDNIKDEDIKVTGETLSSYSTYLKDYYEELKKRRDKELEINQSLKAQLETRKNQAASVDFSEFISSYGSLVEIWNDRETVVVEINKAKEEGDKQNSDLAGLYETILEMRASLERPYEKKSNDAWKEVISRIQKEQTKPIAAHAEGFKNLCSGVNNYRLYMFDLADIITAPDFKTANELLEDSQYLKAIPYIGKVLQEFLDTNGKLKKPTKEALYKTDLEPFSKFKNKKVPNQK